MAGQDSAARSQHPQPGHARDRALARVRHLTAATGVTAAVAAAGLGLLVASETKTGGHHEGSLVSNDLEVVYVARDQLVHLDVDNDQLLHVDDEQRVLLHVGHGVVGLEFDYHDDAEHDDHHDDPSSVFDQVEQSTTSGQT